MKYLAAIPALLLLAASLAGEDAAAVCFIGHDQVAASLANSGPLLNAPNLRVLGNHRSGPGEVEVHEKETHVFYVTEGSATLVTGGTVVGGKVIRPGEIRGTGMEGGQVQQLSKGDVIVIPAGTSHWFKELQSVSYFAVNISKP